MKSKDRRECVDCLQHQTVKVTVEGNSLGENPECLQSCIEAPGLLELAISLQFLQDGSTGHTSQLLTTQELGKRRFWNRVTFTNRYKPSCIRIEPEVEMAPLWIPTQGTTNYISFHWAIGCLEQGFQGTKAFYWTRRVACLRTPTDAVVQVMLSILRDSKDNIVWLHNLYKHKKLSWNSFLWRQKEPKHFRISSIDIYKTSWNICYNNSKQIIVFI